MNNIFVGQFFWITFVRNENVRLKKKKFFKRNWFIFFWL